MEPNLLLSNLDLIRTGNIEKRTQVFSRVVMKASTIEKNAYTILVKVKYITNGAGLNLEDVITTINPVYMVSLLILSAESVFMIVTVDELIFKGWPMDTYIELYERIKDILNPWPPFFPDLPPGHLTLPDLPPPIVNENLGFCKSKNDSSDDGIFQVNRGTLDYRQFAEIEAWGRNLENLLPYLSYWPGDKSYCNEIQGTDGTVLISLRN
uniref:Uncharacterized protein n=1 Tax=Daphnia galeata TaxID=27404 RepID=A0A8J2WHS8_9CRUS|nr:unnamed protein product [Daphnia galeata]